MRWLPWAISVLAVGYVAHRLLSEDPVVWEGIWPPSATLMGYSLVALALMPLNWALEGEKWRLLIHRWYPNLTRKAAFQAVLCGLSMGIFTPNRVGEYPGRIMTLAPGYRWEAAVSMLVDRWIQMVVTVWLGIAAIMLLADYLPLTWQQLAVRWLPWLVLVAVTAPIVGLLLIPYWVKLVPGHGIGARIRIAFSAISPKTGIRIFLLSLLRNGVFSLQFLIMLYGAGLDLAWTIVIPLIWLIFLIKSVVPYWTFTELGIRESIAISVFGLVGVAAAIAFSATFLLYVFNLIIPSLWGLRWIHRISWAS